MMRSLDVREGHWNWKLTSKVLRGFSDTPMSLTKLGLAPLLYRGLSWRFADIALSLTTAGAQEILQMQQSSSSKRHLSARPHKDGEANGLYRGVREAPSAWPRQRGSFQGNPPALVLLTHLNVSLSPLLREFILWSILSAPLDLSSYITQSSPIKQGHSASTSASFPSLAYCPRYSSPSHSHVKEPLSSHNPSLDSSVTPIYYGDEWGGCTSGPGKDQHGHCNADSIPDRGTGQAQRSYRRLHACWPVVLSTPSDFWPVSTACYATPYNFPSNQLRTTSGGRASSIWPASPALPILQGMSRRSSTLLGMTCSSPRCEHLANVASWCQKRKSIVLSSTRIPRLDMPSFVTQLMVRATWTRASV